MVVVIMLYGDRVHLRKVVLFILCWALNRERRSRLLLWLLLRLRLLLRMRLLLQRLTRVRTYTVMPQYLIYVPEIQLSHVVLRVTRGYSLIKVLLERLRQRRLLVMLMMMVLLLQGILLLQKGRGLLLLMREMMERGLLLRLLLLG